MVKIRLRRMGAKKAPYYRVVVADSRFPRDGRFIEEIGTYNPCVSPAAIKIDAERAKEWIKSGAQPTDTVRADTGTACRSRRHGEGHWPSGPHRQRDSDCGPVLCSAHRREGFRRHCGLKERGGAVHRLFSSIQQLVLPHIAR